MPVYSLNDQGFFDGSRAIMQGIQGYRQKKQQDLENKWHDDEFGLQRSRLDLERQSQQSRSAMDQAKFDEEKQTGGLSRDLMRRKLQPVQFDPAKHIKTGPDGTQYIIDPESGAVTKMVEPDPYKEWLRRQLAPTAATNQPPQPPQGPPPVGTNTVRLPTQPPADPAVGGGQLPALSLPGMRIKSFGPNGPTFAPETHVEQPSVVERDVPGQGKQLFLRTVDPESGQEKIEPYRIPESAGKITEKQTTEANLKAARRYAQEIKATIDRSGTYESGIFGNPDDAATLQRDPYLLAIAMAKVLDPGSVAREGEVAAAQKYIIPMGAFASKATALSAIKQHLADLDLRANDLGLQAPGSAPGEQTGGNLSVEQKLSEAAAAIAQGKDVTKVKQRLLELGVPAEQVNKLGATR